LVEPSAGKPAQGGGAAPFVTWALAAVIAAYALTYRGAPPASAPVAAASPRVPFEPRGSRSGGIVATIDVVEFAGAAVRNPNSAVPIRVPIGSAVTISGWAVDRSAKQSASSVAAVVDDTVLYDGFVDINRPDVAVALGAGAPARSGFAVTLQTTNLLPGRHVVRLRYGVAGGARYVESADRIVLALEDARTGAPPQLEVTLDTINGEPAQAASPFGARTPSALNLAGWVTDRGRRRPVDRIEIAIDGRSLTVGQCCGPRPDVAVHFDDPAAGASGFSATVRLAGLATGTHVLALRAYEDGRPAGPDVVLLSITR